MPPKPAVAAAAAAFLCVGLVGCSGDRPQVELSQASVAPPAPTVTVTVTELMTPTVTRTTTQTMTTTATATVTALPRPSLSASTTFNQSLATLDYTNLIDDVRVLDGMPGTGSPTALQFEVLARHLASLRANGAPPGIDPPSYYSRLGSLQLFAEAASTEAGAGSPQAAARYAVIRQETGVLLSLVNGALRTHYALPAAPSSGSSASVTLPVTPSRSPAVTPTTPPPR